jgi:hypothetical protein
MSGELKAEPVCFRFPHPQDCDDCMRAAENAAEIRELVTRADEALRQALSATGKASGALGELAGNRVYDIEIAESLAGADAAGELERAALSLRHAHRIIAARKRLLAAEETRDGG